MAVSRKKKVAVRKRAEKLKPLTFAQLVAADADIDTLLDKIDDEIAEKNGKRSKAVEAVVLAALQYGLSSDEAADLTGLHGTTVRKWIKENSEFGALVNQAKSRGKLRKAIYLERNCAAGDTASTIFFLRTHSEAFYQDPTVIQKGGEKVIREVHFIPSTKSAEGKAQKAEQGQ